MVVQTVCLIDQQLVFIPLNPCQFSIAACNLVADILFLLNSGSGCISFICFTVLTGRKKSIALYHSTVVFFFTLFLFLLCFLVFHSPNYFFSYRRNRTENLLSPLCTCIKLTVSC